MGSYHPRIVDRELDELSSLPAIVIDGPRGVGKTTTAVRRAAKVWRLDDAAELAAASAQPGLLTAGPHPTLIDEWQRFGPSWDLVRRSVDDATGSYLLTGSMGPGSGLARHSGAGRMVHVRMRPLSLAERQIATPTVSLAALLASDDAPIAGTTSLAMTDYVEEILRSGFPGIRSHDGRARRARLHGYVAALIEQGLPDEGVEIRKPDLLQRWLRAYAGTVGTTAGLQKTIDAVVGNDSDRPPTRVTANNWRETLVRAWIIDPLPAWTLTSNILARLAKAEKHQLADPALAAALTNQNTASLMADGATRGRLFESLVGQSVRVYAQQAEAHVSHLRDRNGDLEVDLIVETADGRVLALEVKAGAIPAERDFRLLHKLGDALGDRLISAALITTGDTAYRRTDGIAVIPAALLGP